MRKILMFYLLVELSAAIFHGWASYGWFGWLAADLGEFAGSPDALLLYRENRANYLQGQGFLMGLMPGAVAIAVLATMQQATRITMMTRVLQIGIVLVPIATVVLTSHLTPS